MSRLLPSISQIWFDYIGRYILEPPIERRREPSLFAAALPMPRGHAGIAARVLNENSLAEIATAFSRAHDFVSRGRVVDGLTAIMRLRQLGSTSFASKHLRFIQPERAGILDTVIRDNLGYAMNAAGYQMLLNTCVRAAFVLHELGVCDPLRVDGAWYVSDIEAAIFAKLKLV